MSEIDPFLAFEQQMASSQWSNQQADRARVQAEVLKYGSLGGWTQERLEEGEDIKAISIVPSVLDGDEHNVFFLHRRGIDHESGLPFDVRHVACAHIEEAYAEDDPRLEKMFACETLMEGIISRANGVKIELPLGWVWDMYIRINDNLTGASVNPVQSAMLNILVLEKKQPDHWYANPVGGAHELALLSIILGKEQAELAENAHELSETGIIDFDGEQTVRLAA